MPRDPDKAQFNRYHVEDSFIPNDHKFVCTVCGQSEIQVFVTPEDVHLQCAACGNVQPLTVEDVHAWTD